MKYVVEYTDTFGGEANYSWLKRAWVDGSNDAMAWVDGSNDRRIKRAAKAAMGLTGVRGTWDTIGETLMFHPRGSCTIVFVRPDYGA